MRAGVNGGKIFIGLFCIEITMAMDYKDSLKCIVLLIPTMGLLFLQVYMQDMYGVSGLWVLAPLVWVVIAWKMFVWWVSLKKN